MSVLFVLANKNGAVLRVPDMYAGDAYVMHTLYAIIVILMIAF